MSALREGGSTRAWRRLRLEVLVRDLWRCRVPVLDGRIDPAGRPCLLPADQVDHVIPRALGGTDDPANLRAACWQHNRAKSNRLDGDVPAAPAPRTRGRHAAPRPDRAWRW